MQSRPAPVLAPGTELMGPYADAGSGDLYLVRRPDGRVLRMPRLLYEVAAHADGKRDLHELALVVGRVLDRPIAAADVGFLLEHRLRPAHVIAGGDAVPPAAGPQHVLALTHRRPVVPAAVVNRLSRPLEPLFAPPAVALVLAALLVADVWLFLIHGIAPALSAALVEPGWMLSLFVLSVLSLGLHELGHAAACRYGGARPGAIGAGLYLIWPVLYTELNDSYRLGRAGRLRTDLGGVYFNVIASLLSVAAFWLTGEEPLLALAVLQHVLVAEQFIPWLRLDGYYVVSDLVGVPDLFRHVRPAVVGALRRRSPAGEQQGLPPWARRVVVAWALSGVLMVVALATQILRTAPETAPAAVRAYADRARTVPQAAAEGRLIEAALAAAELTLLLIPAVGAALGLRRLAPHLPGALQLHWGRPRGPRGGAGGRAAGPPPG